LGQASAIRARYRLQWLEVVLGFVVEVALPVSFLILAVIAWHAYAAHGRDTFFLWLGAALIATGLGRANQAFFFWTQLETANVFAVVKAVILTPLVLGAWLMAWYSWFRPPAPSLLPRIIGALTALFALAQLLGTPYSTPIVSHSVSTVFQRVAVVLHVCFAATLAVIVWKRTRRRRRDLLALITVALVAIAIFAYELSVLHVPGIWFPFGVGVSRAQFAYAAMDIALLALLLRPRAAAERVVVA
jgi:hypothetical protein